MEKINLAKNAQYRSDKSVQHKRSIIGAVVPPTEDHTDGKLDKPPPPPSGGPL